MQNHQHPKDMAELSRELSHQLAQPICALNLSIAHLKMLIESSGTLSQNDVSSILKEMEKCARESTRILHDLRNQNIVMSVFDQEKH
jgi:hypothetical protein